MESDIQKQFNHANKTTDDRVKQYREPKRMNAAELIIDGAYSSAEAVVEFIPEDYEITSVSTPYTADINCVQSSSNKKTHWAATSARFAPMFVQIHTDTSMKCVISFGFCAH